MLKQLLYVQLLIVAACLVTIAELVFSFPAPSPLIAPLLPPKLRWTESDIRHWVEIGSFETSYLEYFSRDPTRHVPIGSALVSPADGTIQAIVYNGGKTYLIIGLSFWDVHVVRTPSAGVVSAIDSEGAYFSRNESKSELAQAFFLRGKEAPVQQVVHLHTSRSEMSVRLITSYWASRIKVWVHTGQHLDKGERIGRILLGSTVVLELAGRVPLAVRIGQHLTGGESIILEGRDAR